MNLTKLTVFARRVHRFFVLIISVLGIIMSVTGTKLKFPELLKFYDVMDAREHHNLVSGLFAPVLFIMSITGLVLYLYPYLQKWFRPKIKTE